MIGRLFRRTPTEAPARLLYAAVVAQSRQPAFFREAGVPDTVDGRFEMVALHAYLLLRRLKAEGEGAAPLAQALFDTMFADMDASLREMGAGDLGVGRRVKRMATGFYGRIAAYELGLATGGAPLADALRRNLFGTVTPPGAAVAAMASYMQRVAVRLAAQPRAALLAGTVEFGPADPMAGDDEQPPGS